jgi:hypothetical protein
MAAGLYDEFRDGILGNGTWAQPDLDTNDIRATLYDVNALAVNFTTHVDLVDIASAQGDTSWEGGVAPGKSVGSAGTGAFSHTAYTLSSVAAGASAAEGIVYFDWETAVDSSSPLICYLDTWTGLPITPNGGDIILTPAAGGVLAIPQA